MPIITEDDLSTNIYPEVISEIVRRNPAVTPGAINAAIQEAKMYLGRYDLLALFGTGRAAPTVPDAYLSNIVKDIACWHLIRLSNAGVDYTVYRTAYEDAIAALKSIMAGQAQPEGWPYIDTTTETTPKGDAINFTSNPKRNNFY